MADGRCDWQGCDSAFVQPAVVRLHEHDDARAHEPHTHEYRFELCVPHAGLLVQFVSAGDFADAPLDPERER